MGAFSVQKTKLGFKKKTKSQVLILDKSKYKLAYFNYSFVCCNFTLYSYVNKAQKQFGVDSPETPDKYTFESLARKKT